MTSERLRELAADQYGVISRSQCRLIGIGDEWLRHRIGRGEWKPLSHAVLAAAGSPPSERQRVMAAVLDCGEGSVASHRTAAALWGLHGFRLDALDVIRPRMHDANRRCSLARAYEPRLLLPHHCTVLDGIPVTTPARTLFDLAGIERPEGGAGRRQRLVP